jgi:hypothetical protein
LNKKAGGCKISTISKEMAKNYLEMWHYSDKIKKKHGKPISNRQPLD